MANLQNMFIGNIAQSAYDFTIPEIDDALFYVVHLTGEERISAAWHIELLVVGTEIFDDLDDISYDKVIKEPCRLELKKNGQAVRIYNGLISEFQIVRELKSDIYLYRIRMESHLSARTVQDHRPQDGGHAEAGTILLRRGGHLRQWRGNPPRPPARR